MNISKITLSSYNFGQITKNAAQKAVATANGDCQKLNEIKSWVKQEKNNYMYDVRLNKKGPLEPCGRFGVYEHGGNNHCLRSFDSFEYACLCASGMRKVDISNGIKEVIPNIPEHRKLALEILSMCED